MQVQVYKLNYEFKCYTSYFILFSYAYVPEKCIRVITYCGFWMFDNFTIKIVQLKLYNYNCTIINILGMAKKSEY